MNGFTTERQHGFEPPLTADEALTALTNAVRAAGADEVEAVLLARAGEHTRFAGDRVHQPQDVLEQTVLVRAIVDGHAGRAATSDLRRLDLAARQATAIATAVARAAAVPGRARLAPATPDATPPPLWHEDTAAFDAGARVALAGAAMSQAHAAGGSAAGMIGRAATQMAVVTSAGVARHVVAAEASASLTVTVADGSSRWSDLGRSSSRLGVGAGIEAAVRRALAGRGRVPLPPGTWQVVLGPEAVGELLGFLDTFGFAGDLAAAGVGVCASRAGERVASPLVTVADDALAPVGLPIPFDIEGVPKRRVPLLTDGVVGEPVTDLALAAALGRPPTGHAHIAREAAPAPVAANIVMSPGRHTERELIAGVERGVYVERFWYTRLTDRQSAAITGVSRDGCFLIEDGRLGQPVRGARFTQPVLEFLATVDGVGNELRSQPIMNVWNGVVTAPAVRGHGFRFGFGDG